MGKPHSFQTRTHATAGLAGRSPPPLGAGVWGAPRGAPPRGYPTSSPDSLSHRPREPQPVCASAATGARVLWSGATSPRLRLLGPRPGAGSHVPLGGPAVLVPCPLATGPLGHLTAQSMVTTGPEGWSWLWAVRPGGPELPQPQPWSGLEGREAKKRGFPLKRHSKRAAITTGSRHGKAWRRQAEGPAPRCGSQLCAPAHPGLPCAHLVTETGLSRGTLCKLLLSQDAICVEDSGLCHLGAGSACWGHRAGLRPWGLGLPLQPPGSAPPCPVPVTRPAVCAQRVVSARRGAGAQAPPLLPAPARPGRHCSQEARARADAMAHAAARPPRLMAQGKVLALPAVPRVTEWSPCRARPSSEPLLVAAVASEPHVPDGPHSRP